MITVHQRNQRQNGFVWPIIHLPIANCWFNNMIIRPAIPDDLPLILEIAQQSATAAQWTSVEYARMLTNSSLSARLVLVIGEEGTSRMVHGFLVAKEIAGEWEIENLAVHESQRRRGLGLRLLREFLEQVRLRQAKAIFLEVRESNAAARALYEQCTFSEAGRRRSYYQNPQEDALILKFSFFGK